MKWQSESPAQLIFSFLFLSLPFSYLCLSLARRVDCSQIKCERVRTLSVLVLKSFAYIAHSPVRVFLTATRRH